MRRVIIESPFAGSTQEERDRNISYGRSCLKDALDRGESPLAGHLLYTQPDVLDDDVAEERQLGIRAHLVWIIAADALVVYQDYGISPGMKKAIESADAHMVQVEYRRILHPELSQN